MVTQPVRLQLEKNDIIIINDELEKMWVEVAVAYF
jgi:hypothetical protein